MSARSAAAVHRRLHALRWIRWTLGALAVSMPLVASAQRAAPNDSGRAAAATPRPLTLAGRIVRQEEKGDAVIPGSWVVLHRITPERAGPVDSMRTDARGAYRFAIRPDSGAIYLASTQYAGIAYFSAPAGSAAAGEGAGGDIAVFDTTSADVPLQLQGRHLVVSSPNASGVRAVIDVLEIENGSVRTRVSSGNDRPTFELLLPRGATNARASQGQSGDAELPVREGRARIFNPLSPGLRQVVLTYDLDAKAFPLSLTLERSVGVLEVLLEDTTATARADGMQAEGVVHVDGRAFARFLWRGAPERGVLAVDVPGGTGGGSLPSWLLPVALSLVALGALVVTMRPAMTRQAATPAPPLGAAVDPALAIAREAATLDALLDSPAARFDGEGRAAIRARRTALAQHLQEILADRTVVR